MKIFLSNPPWRTDRTESGYGVRAGSRWPHFEDHQSSYMPFPFFLAYAASVLEREKKIQVLLVDSIAENHDVDAFLERIAKSGADFLLIETSTPSIEWDLSLCREIRGRFPDLRIALSGPHSEMYHPEFLGKHLELDFVLIGEYEYTLRDLILSLSEKKALANVPGLIYRMGEDSRPVSTGRRPLIRNLDELPFPARHFLPMSRYCDTPGGIPSPSLQIIASRGCPFGCIFCSWPQIMYGSSCYRTRSAANIADEIEHCRTIMDIRSVYFDDDTFNLGEKRILELCEEFIRRKFDLPWAAMARVDTMTKMMLKKMKEAGLYAVKYGVESSNQAILDASKKRLDLKKAEQTIALTKSLGIKVHLTFCFGLPGETRQTINETIQYSLDLDPDSVQYSIVTPYPGSEYYEMLKADNQIKARNWDVFDGSRGAVFETQALSQKDFAKALRIAHRRWATHSIKRRFFRKFPLYSWEFFKHPIRSVQYFRKLFSVPKQL